MNFLDEDLQEKDYEKYAKLMNKIEEVNFYAGKYNKAKVASKRLKDNSNYYKEIFKEILTIQGYSEKNFAKNYLKNILYPAYMLPKVDSQKDNFENIENAPISDCLPYIFSKHLDDEKFDALWELFFNFGHLSLNEFKGNSGKLEISFVPYFFDSEVGKNFKLLVVDEIVKDAQNLIGKKHEKEMQRALNKIENKDFELKY